MEIWTAILIGFLGSFHCIGMCGPIALALPGKNDSTLSLIIGRTLYNFGRIVTYSVLGAVFGLLGHSFVLAGLQQWLSVTLGLLVITTVFLSSGYFETLKQKAGVTYLFDRLKDAIRTQFNKRGMTTLFSIGLLNGLLPCGFVYLGLAGSLTTGSVWQGSLYMALFGLGTFPAMFTMAMAPGFISLAVRQKINRIIPYLAVAFGIYLIYRGLAFNGIAPG